MSKQSLKERLQKMWVDFYIKKLDKDTKIKKNTIAYKTFNKRYRDLDPQEMKEYNRDRKQAERNRKKEK